MVIWNKSDLYKDRQISMDKGIEKAKTLNVQFLEASALDKINVNEAFNCLFKELYLDIRNKTKNNVNNNEDGNIGKNVLELNTETKKKKKCC